MRPVSSRSAADHDVADPEVVDPAVAVWAQTNFSLPVELIAQVRETRAATGFPFDVLITQAIQSTFTRLPELLYPQGPPAAADLFPRAVTRASRRSGGTYAQLTVRFPREHLDTVHTLARDLGASSSSHLVVTALQAYLAA